MEKKDVIACAICGISSSIGVIFGYLYGKKVHYEQGKRDAYIELLGDTQAMYEELKAEDAMRKLEEGVGESE